jgi:hypothetical protein
MGRATRMTISKTMLPPAPFPRASELTDTKIDPREGHLTINKGRGGADGRTLTTNDDNDGHVAPERCCPRLRMRTLRHDEDWRHSLPCINIAGICGAL